MKLTSSPSPFTRQQIKDLDLPNGPPRPRPTAPAMRAPGAVLLASIVGRTLPKKEGS